MSLPQPRPESPSPVPLGDGPDPQHPFTNRAGPLPML